jgi:hypothetical protein
MPCGARVEISATVAREADVLAGDHVDVALRMLPIVETARQHELLREELERRGWAREADGALTKVFGDAVATLPAGSATIRVEVSDARAVSVQVTERRRVAPTQTKQGQREVDEAAHTAAERALAEAEDDARDALVQRNIQRLQRVHDEVAREAGEVVNAATRHALEERATAIGAIESVQEGRGADGGYELTVTVRT